jgi:hypothetical protein
MTAGSTQSFNDDLLLSQVERDLAEQRFAEIFHVINFPELRELFQRYEMLGGLGKATRHHIGLLAVALAAIGLLAATPLLSDEYGKTWAVVIGVVSAILGMVGVWIGSFGIFSGESRERWLCARLMTERLRQFQFQILTNRLPEVLSSSTFGATGKQNFIDQRKMWLAEFRLAYEGHLPARLQAILDDDVEEDFMLLRDEGFDVEVLATEARLGQIFAAYRLLRLEHQLQYANYKLRAATDFSNSPVNQFRLLRNIGLVLIFLILIAHLAVAVSLSFHWPTLADNRVFHFFMLALVVGILATRAVEEGLQPAREVERYTRYRASVVSLLGRFDRAIRPDEKVRVMREMERTSYQEMRGFLKTHFESRYVL